MGGVQKRAKPNRRPPKAAREAEAPSSGGHFAAFNEDGVAVPHGAAAPSGGRGRGRGGRGRGGRGGHGRGRGDERPPRREREEADGSASERESEDDDEAPPVDPLAQLMSTFATGKKRRAREPRGARDAEGARAGGEVAMAAADEDEHVSEAGADPALGASNARYDARWAARWTAESTAAARAAAAPAAAWVDAALGQCVRLGGGGREGGEGPPAVPRPLRSIDELVLPAIAARWRAMHARPHASAGGRLTRAQAALGGWLAAGCDVECADLFSALPPDGAAYARAAAELLPLLVAHAADHVVRTRAVVLAHTKALDGRRRRQLAQDKARAEAEQAARPKGKRAPPAAKPPPPAPAPRKRGARGEAAADSDADSAADSDADADGAAADGEEADGGEDEERFRDQGFTRPKALFIVPFRHHALALVRVLARLLPAPSGGGGGGGSGGGGGGGGGGGRPEGGGAKVFDALKILKEERLDAEYGDDGDDDDDDADESDDEQAASGDGGGGGGGGGASAKLSNRQKRKAELRRRARDAPKPADHVSLFGGARPLGADGGAPGARVPRKNADDCFALGVRVSRRALRPFAPLVRADVIIASPLGLKQLAHADGDETRGYGAALDCLSSVEVCYVLFASALAMQNWAHVGAALSFLNRVPTEPGETDFARVRPCYLDGLARALRQTVLLSEHASAEAAALMRTRCESVGGLVRARCVRANGYLERVLSASARIVLRRFDAISAAQAADARFEAFVEQVMPMLAADGSGQGTLVFVPSYFDYVRLRNKLRASDVEAAELCEYTEPKEASRARSLFAHGELKALLYTERAHFFHRHALRGVRHVCFYGLPANAHLFAELANLLGAAPAGGGAGAAGAQTMLVLFSAFDKLQLERAIGSERAQRVLEGDQRTFVMH